MLSRISSFSGPSSKFFQNISRVTFTTSGLILRYEFKGTQSYSGSTTIKDIVGSSDAALTNGPLYSTNGYLSFDGTNDYLITSTSLNSKLNPANTSALISYFAWVYPTDDGVLVTEQGTSSLNSSWHDAQIEIVAGTMKFGVWTGLGSTSFSSSISTPLYRWYYVGLTYDGSTLRGYIDSALAGSMAVARSTPYSGGAGLHYALGATDFTNLGDGTYARSKVGAFHVYNKALSAKEISNNYATTKSNYIYSQNLLIWADANDSVSFSGGKISNVSSGGYTHSLGGSATSSTLHGIRSFDCSNATNAYVRIDGTGPTLSASGYTYVSWARLVTSNSTWRTLFRAAPNDHQILVEIGTDNLGFFDNDSNAFYDSGYDVTSIAGKWVQYAVVGDSSSSEFYINGDKVGSTVAYGAGGNKHDYFGGITGQPFGHIGNMLLYDAKLTQDQIKQCYDALKHVYEQGNFTIENLRLYYNPGNLISYPGSGTSLSDLSGNSLNGTMANVTFETPYMSFNGSTSQVTISDNSLLEPGSGDWTIEVWINLSSYSAQSQTIIGKFDPGGLSADIAYAIRIANNTGNVRCDYSNGVTSVSTSNFTLSPNVWYQLVYVFDNASNNIITYVNGSSYSTTANSSVNSILNTTANLYLGSYNNGEYPQYFNGKMGIVRLYSSALSASDVSRNFEANRSLYVI